jgi:serine-type D-Ala-D-Ala carboxypeptidase (penicillin-binding protein 5/6)
MLDTPTHPADHPEKTMRRRCVPPALVVLLCLAPAQGQQPEKPKAPADSLDGPPLVSAKAWAVVDGKTGKLLWGSREAEPLPIASTTKVMTARLVLRLAAADAKVLDEEVTISERAAKTTGSSAKIRAGERYAVRDLLYGLLLPSGNDAAVALAEYFGPRFKGEGQGDGDAVALFVAEMNREAQALKLAETRYLDPHGLGRNTSSARDLVALTWQTMQDPLFRRYVNTRLRQCEAVDGKGERRTVVWESTNRLLDVEGYDGVKTGTTTAAGNCLLASGRRDGDHLLVVVLGCASGEGRYLDARNLFRWAWRERGDKAEETGGDKE